MRTRSSSRPITARVICAKRSTASLACTRDDWEVLVVDNNSTDDTRDVVATRAGVPRPAAISLRNGAGRSPALNAGIRAARGRIIATTDDDVRVPADWLDQAGGALDALGCDYVGGRVLPIWNGPRPGWLPERKRQALGRDRVARLRTRIDRVWRKNATRRQHGVPPLGVRSSGSLEPGRRAPRRHAPRAGGPRMVRPGA